jgi:hypothetical protein
MPTLSVDTARWILEELPFTQLPLSEFTPVRPDPFPLNPPVAVMVPPDLMFPVTSSIEDASGVEVPIPTRLFCRSTKKCDVPTRRLSATFTFPEKV